MDLNTPNDYLTTPMNSKGMGKSGKISIAQIVVGVVGSVITVGGIAFIVWAIVDIMQPLPQLQALPPRAPVPKRLVQG